MLWGNREGHVRKNLHTVGLAADILKCNIPLQPVFAFFCLRFVRFPKQPVDLSDLKPCLLDRKIDVAEILNGDAERRNEADRRHKLARADFSRGEARDADADDEHRGNRIDDARQGLVKIQADLCAHGRFVERIVLLRKCADAVIDTPKGFQKRKAVCQIKKDAREPLFAFPDRVGIAGAFSPDRLCKKHGNGEDRSHATP